MLHVHIGSVWVMYLFSSMKLLFKGFYGNITTDSMVISLLYHGTQNTCTFNPTIPLNLAICKFSDFACSEFLSHIL